MGTKAVIRAAGPVAVTAVSVAATPVGKPARRVPVRTCVACRTSGGKRGLLRVVRLGAGESVGTVVLDATGKKSGRGAYLCPTAECVALALKQKKLERSLKTPIGEEVAKALRAAVTAADTEFAASPSENEGIPPDRG